MSDGDLSISKRCLFVCKDATQNANKKGLQTNGNRSFTIRCVIGCKIRQDAKELQKDLFDYEYSSTSSIQLRNTRK